MRSNQKDMLLLVVKSSLHNLSGSMFNSFTKQRKSFAMM